MLHHLLQYVRRHHTVVILVFENFVHSFLGKVANKWSETAKARGRERPARGDHIGGPALSSSLPLSGYHCRQYSN